MPAYAAPTEPFRNRQMPKEIRHPFAYARCHGCGQPYEDGWLMGLHICSPLLSPPSEATPRPKITPLLQCLNCGEYGQPSADLAMDQTIVLVKQLYTDTARFNTVLEHGGEAWPTRR